VQRGEVLAHPDQYQPTRRIDARLRLLPDASSPLKHNSEVKFFVGASETIANARLLGKEELNPGEEGWIQLELRDPIVTVRGDRYILRRPSPGETLGGGVVLDHQPGGRHKRFDESVLRSLESLAQGSPADVMLEAALALDIASIKEVVSRSRLDERNAASAIQELLATESLIPLDQGVPATGETLVMAVPRWNALREKVLQIAQSYHQQYPLRRGIPREELKSRLKLQPRPFNLLITNYLSRNLLRDQENLLALPNHEVTFDRGQQARVQVLMRKFEQSPFSPPGVKEIQQEVGEEILNALIESNDLITVSSDVVFRKQDYDLMVARIREEIQQKEKISLAEVRNLFNTSRKYAQALLEHLDSIGITMRDGDFRKLRKT
jgi:selenocysteine-specific elongation factor